MRRIRFIVFISACIVAVMLSGRTSARQTPQVSTKAPDLSARAVFDKYSLTCHSQKLHTAGLDLESLDVGNPGANTEVWEKIILKLRAGSMPPPGSPRPDAATYRAIAG